MFDPALLGYDAIDQLIAQAEYEEADRQLDAHLRNDPGDPYARFRCFQVNFFLERYDESLFAYERLIDLRPDWDAAYVDQEMLEYAREHREER